MGIIHTLWMIVVITVLVTIQTACGATCAQCRNFNTFLVSPQLNPQALCNETNYLNVDCYLPNRCVKLEGALYRSSSSIPQPNTLDGIQRGCANKTLIDFLYPTEPTTGQQSITEGCAVGDRYIRLPWMNLFQTSLEPIYHFRGSVCSCSGAACNDASMAVLSVLAFMSCIILLLIV